ncbi:hypothetical protein HAX54_036807 [Datura stramonium]|uniref:Uncharacterized protein n=1 Tax=Datura stramonium TaxID=4076 RepID=A0ABS8RMI3_DATST|nr:hypothetical protein [Datura stramonium]
MAFHDRKLMFESLDDSTGKNMAAIIATRCITVTLSCCPVLLEFTNSAASSQLGSHKEPSRTQQRVEEEEEEEFSDIVDEDIHGPMHCHHPAAAPSLPEQNSGPRHEDEAHEGISENVAELTLDMENEGVLSEFCASRRSASLESLSTASILARASREHWANQNSSEESIELNESEITCDGNEISTGIRNLCVDRVKGRKSK